MATEPPKTAQSIPFISIPQQTILVVDDIPQNITLLLHILSRQGHTVFTAGNGLEAIENYKALRPDLILMDIEMRQWMVLRRHK